MKKPAKYFDGPQKLLRFSHDEIGLELLTNGHLMYSLTTCWHVGGTKARVSA